MHFKGDFGHAAGPGDFGGFLPIGDKDLIPLPVQDFAVVLRPGAGDPVGPFGGFTVAGTAGEGDDRIHAELFRQAAGVHKYLVIRRGLFFIRMDRVAVAGEDADFEVKFLQQVLEFGDFVGIVEIDLGFQMVVIGVTAGAELHGLDSEGMQVGEGIPGGHTLQRDGENS